MCRVFIFNDTGVVSRQHSICIDPSRKISTAHLDAKHGRSSNRRAVQLAAIEANRELERSGDPCDPMALLQRCGEDDAAAELWDLET